MGLDNNLLFAFALAQGGEFAFVLFFFAVQNRVIDTSLANPLIAVVAVSMAFTPLLMLIDEKFVQPRFGAREKEEKPADEIENVGKDKELGWDTTTLIEDFGKKQTDDK